MRQARAGQGGEPAEGREPAGPGQSPLAAGPDSTGAAADDPFPPARPDGDQLGGDSELESPTPAGPNLPLAKAATPFVDRHRRPLYLDDLYLNQSLFLILSGPSLLTEDLDLLSRRGVVTMGVNNSPSMLRTNLWTFVDTPDKFHDGIWRDPYTLKIIPERKFGKAVRQKRDGTFQPARTEGKALLSHEWPGVIGYQRNAWFEPTRWLSEKTINWGSGSRERRRNKSPFSTLNVMFASIKIAYSLGFRTVYLVGCDFRMTEEQPYAFGQGKMPGAADSNNRSYSHLNQMFGLLKPHFDEAGFRVVNCTAGSGFVVFPHLPLARAVQTATAEMPSEPWDIEGWYER